MEAGHQRDQLPVQGTISMVAEGWKCLFSLGETQMGQIVRAARYFNVNHLSKNEKLATAGVSFDRDVLSWLQWTEVRAPIMNWADFKQ